MSESSVRTHPQIDRALCGRPVRVVDGEADVELTTLPSMAADARGLVHGGFVFGAADYAAMLAVNDPLVVLGKAEVKFTAPAVVGDVVLFRAKVTSVDGKKRIVDVEGARRGADGSAGVVVFSGSFTCIVPTQHVLDR